ncbi:MAG: TolC family protein, partial [Deltaproteobacteria bacterium]
MKFKIIHIAIITLLTLLAQSSHAGDVAKEETLPTLIATALVNNPELKSSQARWQMFTNKVKQVGALEDPMFMFKLQNVLARQPLTFGGADPQTAKVIGISQQLPFWGKRAIKEEVARYEAESYKWAIEERKLELTRMVKETWYQIYAVDKALEVVDKNIRI